MVTTPFPADIFGVRQGCEVVHFALNDFSDEVTNMDVITDMEGPIVSSMVVRFVFK